MTIGRHSHAYAKAHDSPLLGLKPRAFTLAIIVLAHVLLLFVLVDHGVRQSLASGSLRVEFILAPQAERPLRIPRQSADIPGIAKKRVHVVSKSSSGEPPRGDDQRIQSLRVFDTNGGVILAKEKAAQPNSFDINVTEGRELMGRGLNCVYANEHHESLGESTARKYLAWLGLYNPYAANRSAELEEEREERCKRWKK